MCSSTKMAETAWWRYGSRLVLGLSAIASLTVPASASPMPCKSASKTNIPEWGEAGQWRDGSNGGPRGIEIRFTNKCLHRDQAVSWKLDNGKKAVLRFQRDGNVVLYEGRDGNPKDAVWSTGTNGDRKGFASHFSLQTDGNMVLYDIDGHPLWASRTWACDNRPHTIMMLQSDGNMVIYTMGNFNKDGWSPKWDAWGNRHGCH
jgi:exopolysaccharide biosynthesis protein